MKLYYLSVSTFSDNQMSLLKHLSDVCEINYGVIIPQNNSNYSISELTNYCKEYGIEISSFPLKHRYRDLRLIFSYYSILKDINRKNPDIIYLTNFNQLYLNAIMLMLNSSKTIIALHDVKNHTGIAFNYLGNLSKKLLIYKFKYFHTFSNLQENLLSSISKKKKIFNISLPLIDFGPNININKKEEKLINFLFFGNILHYKGLDILLNAFNKVSINYSNIRLTIAGRCNDWDDLYLPLVQNCSQIKTHIGFIENTNIPTFFSEADYVVLPYRDATQSGPLMIAYNYNIPVLVSDAEGFKEFTAEGITGYSFKLHKKDDLEYVLEACMKRSKSDYYELKKNLDLYTKDKFSINTIVNKYNLMFKDVLSIE